MLRQKWWQPALCPSGVLRHHLRTPARPARPPVCGASTSASECARAPASFRVLAFEDTYPIASFLAEGGVQLGTFVQHWNTRDAVQLIREFEPDVLLLDYYIPPKTGLRVLEAVRWMLDANPGHWLRKKNQYTLIIYMLILY